MTLEEEMEESILREHLQVVDFDPIDLFTDEGHAKPMRELSKEQRKMITSFTVEETHVWDGKIRVITGQRFKYTCRDKNSPLMKLAKVVQMIKAEKSMKKEVAAPVDKKQKQQQVLDALMASGIDMDRLAALLGKG